MTGYRFTNCSVEVNPDGQRVETYFDDGGLVIAAPVVDEESVKRARSLGYMGNDEAVVWKMTAEHDLLHSLIAEALGDPFSATLHSVAHHYELPDGVAEREERLVLFAQHLEASGLDLILEERLG